MITLSEFIGILTEISGSYENVSGLFLSDGSAKGGIDSRTIRRWAEPKIVKPRLSKNEFVNALKNCRIEYSTSEERFVFDFLVGLRSRNKDSAQYQDEFTNEGFDSFCQMVVQEVFYSFGVGAAPDKSNVMSFEEPCAEELIAIISDIYEITVLYRKLLNSNQNTTEKETAVIESLHDRVQDAYYYSERNMASSKELAELAQLLVLVYNCFLESYKRALWERNNHLDWNTTVKKATSYFRIFTDSLLEGKRLLKMKDFMKIQTYKSATIARLLELGNTGFETEYDENEEDDLNVAECSPVIVSSQIKLEQMDKIFSRAKVSIKGVKLTINSNNDICIRGMIEAMDDYVEKGELEIRGDLFNSNNELLYSLRTFHTFQLMLNPFEPFDLGCVDISRFVNVNEIDRIVLYPTWAKRE